MPISRIYIFEPGTANGQPAMLLLHGTGGDETQLLEFGRQVAPGAALLSIRGKVLEDGKCRHFARFPDGSLDEEDVVRRSDELAEFIEEARRQYGLAEMVAIGFSNGANIGAALLQRHPRFLSGAVLARAVAPLSEPPGHSLCGKSVAVVSGEHDTVSAPERGAALAEQLRDAGADVEYHLLPCDHPRNDDDPVVAGDWLRRKGLAVAAPA